MSSTRTFEKSSFVLLVFAMGCGGGEASPDAASSPDAFVTAAEDAPTGADDAFSSAGEDAPVASPDAPVIDAAPVDCRAITDADACIAATCRWMTEGCGETPQFWPAGCYPMADCDGPEDCRPGEACTLAIYRPYPPDENPDACGLEAGICVDKSL